MRAVAVLTTAGAAWAGVRHARPAVEAWLSQAVSRGMEGALARFGGSGRVERARLELRDGVRLERVSLTFDRSVEVTAPEVALGVDVPAVLWAAGTPEQALRHVEASGIVIRPAPAQAAEGSQPHAGTPDLREMVGPLRDAVLQLAAGMSGALGGLVQPGEGLTWDLRGVWYPTADGPGRPFVTRGRLEAPSGGRLVAEGFLEIEGLGRVTGRLVGMPGRLEFSPLAFEQPAVILRLSGTVTTAADGALRADLDAEARPGPQSAVGGLARIRLRGPWPPGALPDAVVALEAGEGGAGAPWWWPHLAGGRGEVRVVWAPEGLRLEEGRWKRGAAAGDFTGRVAYPAPHATRLEFRLSGLVPGADVPWWDAYRVDGLDAAGVLEGDWSGSWALRGRLQATPGGLLGVTAGAASVEVAADLKERRLSFSHLQAPLGDGLLAADGEVAWDEAAAAAPDGRGAHVRLQARGRLQEVAVRDLVRAAYHLGLWGQASAPATAGDGTGSPGAAPARDGAGSRGSAGGEPGAAAAAARGSLSGAVELDLAWVDGPDGQLEATLVTLGFDGADGSLGIRLQPDGAYRVESDLVNLSGRALGPLLPGVSGFAAFSGQLAGGRLAGTLTARHLSVRGVRLGELSAPVELAGGLLRAEGATFTGGDLEGRADLRFGGDQPQVARLKAQVTGGEAELPLSASFEVAVAPQVTDLARAAISVSGRRVATASGKLPIGWSSAGVGEPVDVRVVMEEFPLELARRLLPGWEVEGGRISGEVALTGTPSAPRASGQVVASARRLQAPGFPGTLSEASVGVRIDDRHLTITQARARTARDGRVTATGGAVLKSLWPVALEPVGVTATLERAYFSGPIGDAVELSGAWSGALRVEGAWGPGVLPRVSGRLSARGARVVLWGQALPTLLLAGDRPPSATPVAVAGGFSAGAPAAGREDSTGRTGASAGSPPEGSAAAPLGMPLEISLVADEPVALEVPAAGGSGYLDGELVLAGTTAQPALEGELLLTQGRLRYFGREILVERGRLIFSRSGGLRPRVKLQAKTSGPEGPVTLTVEGDPQEAQGLSVASDPPMAREQLAGLLLPPGAAGQPPGSAWAGRLNEQLVAWAMVPLQRAIREAFGLDEFWLTPMPEEQRWVVRLGKYLAPQRMLVRYGRTLGNGQGGQEVDLSTRLAPGVDLQAGYSDILGMRLGLSWEFQF